METSQDNPHQPVGVDTEQVSAPLEEIRPVATELAGPISQRHERRAQLLGELANRRSLVAQNRLELTIACRRAMRSKSRED